MHVFVNPYTHPYISPTEPISLSFLHSTPGGERGTAGKLLGQDKIV